MQIKLICVVQKNMFKCGWSELIQMKRVQGNYLGPIRTSPQCTDGSDSIQAPLMLPSRRCNSIHRRNNLVNENRFLKMLYAYQSASHFLLPYSPSSFTKGGMTPLACIFMICFRFQTQFLLFITKSSIFLQYCLALPLLNQHLLD